MTAFAFLLIAFVALLIWGIFVNARIEQPPPSLEDQIKAKLEAAIRDAVRDVLQEQFGAMTSRATNGKQEG
jgi:hypothetical protein